MKHDEMQIVEDLHHALAENEMHAHIPERIQPARISYIEFKNMVINSESDWLRRTLNTYYAREKIAICMLTVDEPPNMHIWEENFKFIFVNAKNECTGHAAKYMIREQIRDTEWGKASLVKASQALFKEAYESTNCDWFALVSGDSIPTTTAHKLYYNLSLQSKTKSYICSFDYDEDERKDLKHVFANLRTRDNNWWKGKNIFFHEQWVILSRKHAALIVDMDPQIAYDWDELFDDETRKFFPAADEVCIGNYLMYMNETDEIDDDLPVMETVMDRQRMHATLITFDQVKWTHVFARKIAEKISYRRWFEKYKNITRKKIS